MIRPWLRSLPGGVKVFLATIGLSVAFFFSLFAFFLPLVFEYRLLSSRFSAGYVWSFFYSMSLYFIIGACLAVFIYIFIRNSRPEVKIFVITFFATFWGYPGTVVSLLCYWGFPVHFLVAPFFIAVWGGWILIHLFFYFSFYSFAVSAFAVLAYRVYRFVRGPAKVFLSLSVVAFLSAFICLSMLISVVNIDPGPLVVVAFFSYCISLTVAAVFSRPVLGTLEKRKQKT